MANETKTAIITAFGYYNDKPGKLYVSWEWDLKDDAGNECTDHYEVYWRYYISSIDAWYDGEVAKVTHRSGITKYSHTYDYQSVDPKPEQIRVHVTPISVKETKDDTEISKFDAEAVTRVMYLEGSEPPPKPELNPKYKLTKENDKNILTITLQNVEIGNATKIKFKLLEKDPNNSQSGYIEKQTKELGIIFTETICKFNCLDDGKIYKVQFQGVAEKVYGEWSDPSEDIAVSPKSPTILTVTPNCYDPDLTTRKNGVEVIWAACDSATTYEFDFLALDKDETKTPEEIFNNSDGDSRIIKKTINVKDKPEYIINDGTGKKGKCTFYDIAENILGKNCYVRCCSASENSSSILGSGSNSKSTWSEIVHFIFGIQPDFPTTWHSQTNVFPGDELKIFFTHNSQDNSPLTDAEIHFTIDEAPYTVWWNVTDPIIKKMYKNSDNVNDHTYVIEIDTTHSLFASGATITYLIRTAGIYKGVVVEYGSESKFPETGETGIIYTASDTNKTYHWVESKYDEISISNNGTVLSKFSPAKEIKIYTKPTLSIALPNVENDTLESFPLTARFSLTEMSNQNPISYHVSIIYNSDMYDANKLGYEIIDNVGITKVVTKGSVVYSKFIDSVSTDITESINANDVILKNNEQYIIKCIVYLSSGLTVSESRTFNVNWVSKTHIPFAEIGLYKDTLIAHIRPYVSTADKDEIVTLTVYRREFDGSFVQIGTSIQNGTQEYVVDPHPALNYARYRIVARSEATGAIEFNDIPAVSLGEHSIVLQWDEAWTNFYSTYNNLPSEQPWSGSILKLPYNISISNDYKPDVSTVNYIGRKHPVSYYGTHTGETASWSVDIPKHDLETLYAIRRLSTWMGDVYVREPSGSGYWANVTVSYSQKSRDLVIPVTFRITRVEGGI